MMGGQLPANKSFKLNDKTTRESSLIRHAAVRASVLEKYLAAPSFSLMNTLRAASLFKFMTTMVFR